MQYYATIWTFIKGVNTSPVFIFGETPQPRFRKRNGSGYRNKSSCLTAAIEIFISPEFPNPELYRGVKRS